MDGRLDPTAHPLGSMTVSGEFQTQAELLVPGGVDCSERYVVVEVVDVLLRRAPAFGAGTGTRTR